MLWKFARTGGFDFYNFIPIIQRHFILQNVNLVATEIYIS